MAKHSKHQRSKSFGSKAISRAFQRVSEATTEMSAVRESQKWRVSHFLGNVDGDVIIVFDHARKTEQKQIAASALIDRIKTLKAVPDSSLAAFMALVEKGGLKEQFQENSSSPIPYVKRKGDAVIFNISIQETLGKIQSGKVVANFAKKLNQRSRASQDRQRASLLDR